MSETIRISTEPGRPIKEIMAELNAAIEARGIEFGESGFRSYDYLEGHPKVWPEHEYCRWVACYPVIGGSEGYYVHIDLINQKKARAQIGMFENVSCLLATAKTWTWESACAIANTAAWLLDPLNQ